MLKIFRPAFILIFACSVNYISGCVTPGQSQAGSSPSPAGLQNKWLASESATFSNQCNTEVTALRPDLNPALINDYCSCALNRSEERYTFQQLRITIVADPQISNIDQICSISTNLPPEPADFGGPSFGGRCDNAMSYEEKLVCLGLPLPVLPVVPWRK